MAGVVSGRRLGKTQDFSPDCGVLRLDFPKGLEQQFAFRIVGLFRSAGIKRRVAHLDLNGVLRIGLLFFSKGLIRLYFSTVRLYGGCFGLSRNILYYFASKTGGLRCDWRRKVDR